ncbi:hypothetical protein PRIPAC_73810 [Pristionchus pacificus]|nr:hypothetical protein PRIPAC_73810 [Pristionchus pacificus]
MSFCLIANFFTMTINIIRLPKNAFLNILKFSDIQSQLRLRQVSKSVQEFVDFSVLQLKKSIVKSFVCESRLRGFFHLTFRLDNQKNFYLWCFFVEHVTKRLAISGFQLDPFYKTIITILNDDEVNKFLEYLKPLIERTQFNHLALLCSPNMVNVFSDFLEGMTIRSVTIGCRTFNRMTFDLYIHVIEKFRPEYAQFNIEEVNKDSTEGLLRITDLVNCLSILVLKSISMGLVSIVRDLLKGSNLSCKEIFIAIKSPVQNAEIEAIQQILHSNHKKWRIEADTETGAMDIKVGMYAVKTKEDLGRNKRMITIKKIQH